MSPIRILMLLSDGFGGHGGIAKFNRDLLEALDSCVIVDHVCALPRLISNDEVEQIPEAVVYDRKAAGGKLAFVMRALRLTLFGSHYDIVICAHVNLLVLATLTAWIRNARLVLIIHGVEIWTPPKSFFARLLINKIDAILAVSRLSADRFLSWSDIAKDKISILPNSVDLRRFTPQGANADLARRYNLQGRKVLLTVGRLESRERLKGFDNVIELLPRLRERFPNISYLIVGDGLDRLRLEQKAKTMGVSDCVIFTGQISEAEKVAHYCLADAYVMPSLGEGFGIVLIEAAACGVPVVGSNADGSREALLDGRLGRLVDPRNPNELLVAITSALLEGQRGIRFDAIETFSTENFSARVERWCLEQATCVARNNLMPAQLSATK